MSWSRRVVMSVSVVLLSAQLLACGHRGPFIRPEVVINKVESAVKTLDPAASLPETSVQSPSTPSN